jgi:hypothetical protein
VDEQKIVCVRCGQVSFVPLDKRKRKDGLCFSCRMRPAKTISYGFGKPCKPWGGEFDRDDNPLLDGELFMPGERICGHKDCVEVEHCRV